MENYKKVLLTVELDKESDAQIIHKTKEIRAKYNAVLYILHVVEHLSSYGVAYGVPVGIDIEQLLVNEANLALADLGKQLGVEEKNLLVKVGSAGRVIIEEARALQVDLVILGSHGRHGVQLLLGSTANTVLHGAHCDVLAVRLKT